MYHFIECCTIRKTKSLAWVSTVDPSGHFDYSKPLVWISTVDPSGHFDYSYMLVSIEYIRVFVAEIPTMVILSFQFSDISIQVFYVGRTPC